MENEKTELTGKDGWAYLKNVAWPQMQHVGWVRQRIHTTAERAGYNPKLLPDDFDSLYEFFGVDRDGSQRDLTRAATLYFAIWAADRGRNGAAAVVADSKPIDPAGGEVATSDGGDTRSAHTGNTGDRKDDPALVSALIRSIHKTDANGDRREDPADTREMLGLLQWTDNTRLSKAMKPLGGMKGYKWMCARPAKLNSFVEDDLDEVIKRLDTA